MGRRLLGGLGLFLFGVLLGVGGVAIFASFDDPGALARPDTCRDVANATLLVDLLPGLDPVVDPDVVLDPRQAAAELCRLIDELLQRDLLVDPGGFLAEKEHQVGLEEPTIPLVWTDDGCSFDPVRSGGPFGFLPACERHDFAWRNLKRLDREGVAVWTEPNKARADLGFLYDMRVVCAGHDPAAQPFCETAARTFYMAVALNASNVAGIEDVAGTD